MLAGEDSNETYLDEYLDHDNEEEFSLKNTKNNDYIYSPGLVQGPS